MSLFKQNAKVREQSEFFAMWVSHRLAERKYQAGTRFANTSDILTHRAIGAVLARETPETILVRLAALGRDPMAFLAKLQQDLQAQTGQLAKQKQEIRRKRGEWRTQLKTATESGNQPEAEQLKQLLATTADAEKESVAKYNAVMAPLRKQFSENADARNAVWAAVESMVTRDQVINSLRSRFGGSTDIDFMLRNAVDSFFGVANEGEQDLYNTNAMFVDYLRDMPDVSKMSLEDVAKRSVSVLNKGLVKTVERKEQKRRETEGGGSLDDSAGKEDDMSKHDLIADGAPSVEDEATKSPMAPMHAIFKHLASNRARIIDQYSMYSDQLERAQDAKNDSGIKRATERLQAVKQTFTEWNKKYKTLLERGQQLVDHCDSDLQQKEKLAKLLQNSQLDPQQYSEYENIYKNTTDMVTRDLVDLMHLLADADPKLPALVRSGGFDPVAIAKMHSMPVSNDRAIGPVDNSDALPEAASGNGDLAQISGGGGTDMVEAPTDLDDAPLSDKGLLPNITAPQVGDNGKLNVDNSVYNSYMERRKGRFKGEKPYIYRALQHEDGSELSRDPLYGRGILKGIEGVNYAKGLQTRQHVEDLLSGDPQRIASVPDLAYFNHALLELVDERNANYNWEMGKSLKDHVSPSEADTHAKKVSNDIFRSKVQKMISSDPRMQQFAGMLEPLTSAQGMGQGIHDLFDFLRRSGMYMKSLEDTEKARHLAAGGADEQPDPSQPYHTPSWAGTLDWDDLTDEDLAGHADSIVGPGGPYGEGDSMSVAKTREGKPGKAARVPLQQNLGPDVLREIPLQEMTTIREKTRKKAPDRAKARAKGQPYHAPVTPYFHSVPQDDRFHFLRPDRAPRAPGQPGADEDVEASAKGEARYANVDDDHNFFVDEMMLIQIARKLEKEGKHAAADRLLNEIMRHVKG